MNIEPRQPTAKGPAEWFTGDVWIDGIVQPSEDSPLNVAAVHLHPGATPNRFMTHLSLTRGPAIWGEHVTDDEYGT